MRERNCGRKILGEKKVEEEGISRIQDYKGIKKESWVRNTGEKVEEEGS